MPIIAFGSVCVQTFLMWDEFQVEASELRRRLQDREIFALMRSDLATDQHVMPVEDIISHEVSLSCACITYYTRGASTGLTPDSEVIIHRQMSERCV